MQKFSPKRFTTTNVDIFHREGVYASIKLYAIDTASVLTSINTSPKLIPVKYLYKAYFNMYMVNKKAKRRF